jgi:hypothetical protein
LLVRANADFRDKAPVSVADAATIILDRVRSEAWRILVGEDAKKIDAAVRAKPEATYDYAELFGALPTAPARATKQTRNQKTAGISGRSAHVPRHI